MNHIFYKLANDAWIDAPDGGGYAGKIFSKEKFAELIVKECAEKIAHNEKFNWLDAAQAAKDLKEHFGVEE